MKIKNYLIEQWNKKEGEEQVIFISDYYKLPKSPVICAFNSKCFGNIETYNLFDLNYYVKFKLGYRHTIVDFTTKRLYEQQLSYDIYEKYKNNGILDIFNKWEDKFYISKDKYIDFNTDSLYINKNKFDLFSLEIDPSNIIIPENIVNAIRQIKNEN